MIILAARRAKIVAWMKKNAWFSNVSREIIENVVHPDDIDLLNNPVPGGRIRVRSMKKFMELVNHGTS